MIPITYWAKTDQDLSPIILGKSSLASDLQFHLEILSVTKSSINQKNILYYPPLSIEINIGITFVITIYTLVRIFLNHYLLLLFIYGYIKCFLYSFKISISTILNNENGLLIFLVFLHRSHSKETKNYRIKIYI